MSSEDRPTHFLHAPERRDIRMRLASWPLGPEELNAHVSMVEFAEDPANGVWNWVRRADDDRAGAGLPGTFGFELHMEDGTSRQVSVPGCRCAATVTAAFAALRS